MYYVVMKDKQIGPFSQEQMRTFWTEGHINAETLCWWEGQSDWLPIRDLSLGLAEPVSEAVRAVAGFWPRLGAWIIDVLLLWLVGCFLSCVFYNVFILFGVWGFLVGLVICSSYFGVMNSKVGQGATVGKRLLGLEVVDPAGQHLSLPRSYLRYFVFSSPFWLSYALDTACLAIDSLLFIIAYFVILILYHTIAYLFVFNRPTRQSLHDLVVQTYVVQSQSRGPVRELPFWKGHVAVLAAIAAGLVAVGLGGEAALKYLHFDQMLVVQKDVLAQGQFRSASINHGVSYMVNSAGTSKTNVVTVTATWDGLPPAPKTFPVKAKELSALVLKDYPAAQTSDSLNINFRWGYDIGIWAGWSTTTFSHSPADWQTPDSTDK